MIIDNERKVKKMPDKVKESKAVLLAVKLSADKKAALSDYIDGMRVGLEVGKKLAEAR